MNSNVERAAMPNLPAPSHVGQATAIEQSRAVAEVHAAIVVAQQCPRNIPGAVNAMRQSCQQKGLAERAFYRFPRGRENVTGASVYLARELARCWGNIQYGIAELRRDDDAGFSEMQAFAWDVETNTRSAQIFIVPHKRDKRGGPEKLTDLRDVYENNANQGARRLREAIFSVLPVWFTEDAKDLCTRTLADGGGKPLAARVADAIGLFGQMGISVDQLEQKLGRQSGQWTDHDVAQLAVTYQSLKRGEVTRDEEFPAPVVTGAEIASGAQRPAAGGGRANGAARGVDPNRLQRLNVLAGEMQMDADETLAYLSDIAGRPVASSAELTAAEVDRVISKMEAWRTQSEPAGDTQ